MLLRNETRYDGRVLRKLFAWACKRGGVYDRWSRYQLDVRYNRCTTSGPRGVGGCGSVGGAWVRITLPPQQTHAAGRVVARVMLHEIGHNKRLRHSDMIPCARIDVDSLPAALWRVRHLPEPKSTPKDVVVTRYVRAQKHLAEWRRKAKLARTKIAKYQKAVRRYERAYPERVAAHRPEKGEDV